MIGESSNAAGLIPGGIVSLGERAAGEEEANGVAVRKSAVLLRLCALNPHFAALLSAMLLLPLLHSSSSI